MQHFTPQTRLGQSLADICAQHSLYAVDVGINLKQREESRFDVTVHWDGFSRDGISCASGYGHTTQEALTNALRSARDDRTPTEISASFADEPLEVS